MNDYPIKVRRYDANHPADLAICEDCGRENKLDPGAGDPYEMCLRCDFCSGRVAWKYHEADVCTSCGKLGYWGGSADPLKGACSRRCMLQAEYAATRRATP